MTSKHKKYFFSIHKQAGSINIHTQLLCWENNLKGEMDKKDSKLILKRIEIISVKLTFYNMNT